ncbi:MAG: tRNA (adenosine(37)-N6)-dimethylallyltransferase MiaA [Simkaniaceae bacterium]|nr:tRNA (adenosine(37)-N6)-dimethylallyltransferase MiaA [Simkaniaceae bacterium]
MEGHTPLPQRSAVEEKTRKKKVIVIAGPTASSKTDLSLSISRALDGEVISADSMQVYRHMDIGTAKVSQKEREEIPHHMIDIRDINEPYNVAMYCEDAQIAYREILVKQRAPLVVGGVGFYIHSLMYGPPKGPPSVPEIRQRLEEDLNKFGAELMYEKLRKLDPEYAETITLQDRHKIVRGLEIMTITHTKVSDIPKPSAADSPEDIDFRCWFIYYPKEILYKRIEDRCEQMVKEGLIEEVQRLLEMGLEKNRTAANAIGYRQCIEFLQSAQSESDYEHFMNEFKKASRQYAKRQFTWFRKEKDFRWLDLSQCSSDFAAEVIIQDYEVG